MVVLLYSYTAVDTVYTWLCCYTVTLLLTLFTHGCVAMLHANYHMCCFVSEEVVTSLRTSSQTHAYTSSDDQKLLEMLAMAIPNSLHQLD